MIPRTTSGSALVIALGLTSICVALAFACVYVARAAVDTANEETLIKLARQTARAGTAHAMEVLLDSYCRSARVPTHYRQKWHQGFRAIDSYDAGRDTFVASDDKPNGGENTAYDANGNDTAADQSLIEAYTQWKSSYLGRRGITTNGIMRTSGLGRYIEPGCYDTDLVGKPVSFHLVHPCPAVAGSPDPAARRGEDYAPNIDSPIYYDSGFRPVASRDAARYRLRYAVAIEDLSGHLYANFPGPYTAPLNKPFGAAAATVSPADDAGAREIDQAEVDRWVDPLTALVMSPYSASNNWSMTYMARGMGAHWQGDAPIGYGSPPLADFLGGRPRILNDYDQTASAPPAGEPDFFFDTPSAPYYAAPTARTVIGLENLGRGPTLSWEAYKQAYPWDIFVSLPYTYTPYGRAEKAVAAPALPTRWDEGYISCPWRINVPTMTPQVALQIAYAQLPVEPRTYIYQSLEESDYLGDYADGSPHWSNPVVTNSAPGTGWQVVHPGSALRARPPMSSLFAWHANPYPGMDPATPGPDWSVTLGADIDISDRFVVGGPLPGMEAEMFLTGPWALTEKEERFIGGKKIVHTPGNANFYRMAANNAYRYHDSYWLDVHVAVLQTLMTSILVWHGQTGESWTGAPTQGDVRWPAGHRLSTQPAPCSDPVGGAAPATDVPALDADRDGDGTMETPSLVASLPGMDRLFISNMGEYWGDYATSRRPATPSTGVYDEPWMGAPSNDSPDWSYTRVPRRLYAFTPSNNIKSLANVTPGNKREMELVLNDTRMSLFGSSPQYADFRGIDFDDDGTVWCSGYANGNAPADPTTGKGPLFDTTLGHKRFSLSGHVVFQQSHFYRAFVRGEVFDEMRQRPVAQELLESVVTIDPDGSLYDLMGVPTANWNAAPALCRGLEDSQILFQRWHHTLNRGTLTVITP